MNKTQYGVARGMALALLTAIALFAFCATYVSGVWEIGSDFTSRATLASWVILLPAAMLCVCIARLAKHRFFTPEDIHGSALTSGTDKAKLLQALLQNTLEQAAIALPIYIAAAIIVPPHLLSLVPAAGALFVVGRMFFFGGYQKGAPSRAYGFALTFYPTILLLLTLVVLAVLKLAA
jgi:hypothetical protein